MLVFVEKLEAAVVGMGDIEQDLDGERMADSVEARSLVLKIKNFSIKFRKK